VRGLPALAVFSICNPICASVDSYSRLADRSGL
jgi:hypothetical protein